MVAKKGRRKGEGSEKEGMGWIEDPKRNNGRVHSKTRMNHDVSF